MLERMEADLLFLQEVSKLSALDEILKDGSYKDHHRAYTTDKNDKPFKDRNLVILSRQEILKKSQHHHDYAKPPMWRQITAGPDGKTT